MSEQTSRLCGRIWVGSTSSLIAFIAYSSQIWVFWPWKGSVLSVELIQLLLPFNLLVAMIWWNYRLCVTTDPGGVPRGWMPDFKSTEGMEVKKLTGGPRYCRTCEAHKPPRAHHCRQSGRCILRMDHYCPWVNNCVGHYNYGHFVRFLFYIDVSCIYHIVLLTKRVLDTDYRRTPTGTEIVMIILNYTACVPVLFAVGIFSLYHFYCVFTNTTTIESWEKDKVATLVRRGRIREVKFPYHLGVYANICTVLGPRPLLWCWPQRMRGSGLSFPTAEGTGKWVEVHERGRSMIRGKRERGHVELDDGQSLSRELTPDERRRARLWEHPNLPFIWPPKDPYNDPRRYTPRPLRSSPWTYGTDTLNPALVPTSGAIRRRAPYERPGLGDESPSPPRTSSSPSIASSEDEYEPEPEEAPRFSRVRRGSEGYEIRPYTYAEREALVRGDYASRTTASAQPPLPWQAKGRYRVYEPEPEDNDDDDSDAEREWDGFGEDASFF